MISSLVGIAETNVRRIDSFNSYPIEDIMDFCVSLCLFSHFTRYILFIASFYITHCFQWLSFFLVFFSAPFILWLGQMTTKICDFSFEFFRLWTLAERKSKFFVFYSSQITFGEITNVTRENNCQQKILIEGELCL